MYIYLIILIDFYLFIYSLEDLIQPSIINNNSTESNNPNANMKVDKLLLSIILSSIIIVIIIVLIIMRYIKNKRETENNLLEEMEI